jgi:RHS repeat-associated protein
VGLSYAQQRWYEPTTGRFLSEDPIGAEAYLMTPTELGPWLYARGNPLQFRDPIGLGTFCEDRYGTSDNIVCAARSTQQYQFQRQLQAERAGNAGVAGEAKQLWRQAAKDERSRAQLEDFHRNVFQPTGTVALAATVAPAGVAIGGTLSIARTYLERRDQGKAFTGDDLSSSAYGGALTGAAVQMAFTALPTNVALVAGAGLAGGQVGSGINEIAQGKWRTGAFDVGTGGLGLWGTFSAAQNMTPAPRKAWEDFLTAANERLAAAKQEYGELGLQMSADAPRQGSAPAQLVEVLRARTAQLAGFSQEGTPVILDENIAGRGVADALRGRGFNVRSVMEIFGKGGIKDPVINRFAETIRGRVLTADRGRQIGEGFGSNAIQVDARVGTNIDALARILAEELK